MFGRTVKLLIGDVPPEECIMYRVLISLTWLCWFFFFLPVSVVGRSCKQLLITESQKFVGLIFYLMSFPILYLMPLTFFFPVTIEPYFFVGMNHWNFYPWFHLLHWNEVTSQKMRNLPMVIQGLLRFSLSLLCVWIVMFWLCGEASFKLNTPHTIKIYWYFTNQKLYHFSRWCWGKYLWFRVRAEEIYSRLIIMPCSCWKLSLILSNARANRNQLMKRIKDILHSKEYVSLSTWSH